MNHSLPVTARMESLIRDWKTSADRRAFFLRCYLLMTRNIHINYDLVLTLVEMLEPEWALLSAPEREMRYADHCHVNEIIGATIDAVQDDVIETAAPEMDVVDTFLGPVDEWLISRLIARWRDEVWEHALEMLARPELQHREQKQAEIEALTLRRARAILLEEGAIHISHLW